MTERWPEASVVGSDVSTEMLATASQIPSRVRWRHLDVRDWEADHREDVIYSNAVLHWVEDHQALFPRLIGFLAPGGVLAVQMPMSWDEPSHRGILEVLDQLDIGSAALRERYRRSSVAAPEWYIDLLRPLVTHLDVWATRYYQLLEGDDAVVRWVEGTALRPVIDELAPDDLDLFIPTYGRLMRDRYPPLDDGTTVYPFPRLFIVATR
jgi:trans-aconitate 2-methyltransferase